MTTKKEDKISISVPEAEKTGVYSNAVSVSVNDHEIVMDMGYIIPGSSPTQISVVSRVNMTHKTAENFLSLLSDTLLDHRNKKT